MKPLAIWLGLASLAAAAPAGPPDAEDAAYPAIERFVKVLESVRTRHPDTTLLSYDRLVNHALEGMLAGLDPHSSFIHPEMAAAMKQHPEIDPYVPSLGLTFGLREDGPSIAAVAPHGPAADAGVLPGSSLLEIDGQPIANAAITEWLPALTRPAGTVTKLRIKSPANPKAEEHTLTHRMVEHRSVAEAKLWNPGTGYLRLAEFGAGCAAEVEAALDGLEDDGMKALILDLRGNPGGELGETVKILGLLVPPGTEVVSIRGRDPDETEILKTPERQRRKRDYPVVVLIDRMSASASELTAGALRDLKRATVIGETSYGKGSVQNIIPSGAGTALRLTIATYHTPSGDTPHRRGITPDVEVETTEADRTKLRNARRIDSLPPAEREALANWRDPVIQAALESPDPLVR